jgi:rubrerythrin
MQAQDTVTQDVLLANNLTDLAEFARQRSDISTNERSVGQSSQLSEDDVVCVCSRSHTDFFVEPSQSAHLARLRQDVQSNPGNASSQREQPKSALLNQRQSGPASDFDAGCPMGGHWQCQICGARHLGPLPETCEACGADGRYLEHPQEIRLEMIPR